VVLYSGNIGLIQDLDAIIEAADILKDQKDIVFLFGGEGGKKLSLMEKVSQKNLHNVSFLGYVSSGEYNDLLATADCDIVALKPGMDSFGFPVKTYSYMASGRPIIAVTEAENELYRTVRDNDIGISVTDGRSLAEAILRLKNDPALSARLGHNGRSVLLEKFSRAIATKKYCDLIDGEI
jgi:glycosyltransferase involved in cell wall biosynthesis